MKLRTSLTASCDGSIVDATDENLIHDAACAHALMQAIKCLHSDWDAYGEPPPNSAFKIADEIMASWGFDSTPEQPE